MTGKGHEPGGRIDSAERRVRVEHQTFEGLSRAGRGIRPLAANPYRGCGHECAYWYVPPALHKTRAEFDAGAKDRSSPPKTGPGR